MAGLFDTLDSYVTHMRPSQAQDGDVRADVDLYCLHCERTVGSWPEEVVPTLLALIEHAMVHEMADHA